MSLTFVYIALVCTYKLKLIVSFHFLCTKYFLALSDNVKCVSLKKLDDCVIEADSVNRFRNRLSNSHFDYLNVQLARRVKASSGHYDVACVFIVLYICF